MDHEHANSSSAQPHPQTPSTSRTRHKSPEHFTFSNVDFLNNSVSNRQQEFMRKMSTKRRKLTTGHSSCLWIGFMVILFCQTAMFLFQTTISNYYHSHNVASHSEMGLTLLLSRAKLHQDGGDRATNAGSKQSSDIRPRLLIGLFSDYGSDKKTKGTTNSKTYRNRHRKLFRLWNDTRLCPYNAFRQRQRRLHAAKKHPSSQSDEQVLDNDECLILYTFVIGAHPNHDEIESGSIPTMRLEATAEEPLEFETIGDNATIFVMSDDMRANLPADLKRHNDFTLLNIRENMNDGKSPSFFAWAYSEATSLRNIGQEKGHNSIFSYAAKCDLDAMLRLDFVLQVLHRELMWIPNDSPIVPPGPPPTSVAAQSNSLKISTSLRTDPASVGGVVLGCLRHKAMWVNTTNDDFWQANFEKGMHLYLGGQFYIVSNNLIPGLMQEARVQQPKSELEMNYMAGHEDHDVISMIQASAVKNGQLVRWITMPRNYRFWEHPVKGEMWWNRIWKREERKAAEGRLPSRKKYSLPDTPKSLPSLLVVLGGKDPKVREIYREKLITEQIGKRVCPFKGDTMADGSSLCDLYYIFVVGGKDEGPTEIVRGEEELEHPSSQEGEIDLVVLNVRDNIDNGMGQTVLYYLQTRFKDTLRKSVDMIVFCNARIVLLVEAWRTVQYQHARFHHNLIVGDVRDKDVLPVEFGTKRRNETFFFLEHENIHIYTGSDNACFAIGTDLVGDVLQHANESFDLSRKVKVIREDTTRKRKFKIFNPRSYFVQNIGYDLSTLAYMTSFKILHWIPISKGQAPWYHLST